MRSRFSSNLETGLRFSAWPAALTGIVIVKFLLSLALKQSSLWVASSKIIYFLLLLLAIGFAIGNAIQNKLGSRLFWVFLALAGGLWAFDQWVYLYYEFVAHAVVPDNSVADPVLFLHIVPLMAAAATLPHRNASERKLYPATLNFLFLLFFWSFLYSYTVLPYQYLFPNATGYALRFDILYLLENLTLVLALAFLVPRARAPWRAIYFNLLVASALYFLSSTLANLAIDSGGYVNGKLYGLGLTASVCWFVWIPLRARQLTATDATSTRSDAGQDSLASVLAMLAVVIISVPIVWQLFQKNEHPGRRTLRLVVAVAALVGLASAAFIKEYLTKRELAAGVGLAHDRLRLAMESGKSVGWDWDLKSGSHVWFGDLQTVFGVSSDQYFAREKEFLDRVHPDDRENVQKAVDDAKQDHQPFTAECRILWPDGTVRWITTQGKFYCAASGEPERMLGMAVDVTEKKQAERELRESHEKLLQTTQRQERSIRDLILFRALLDQSNDAIQVIEPESLRFLDVNDRICLELGYSREELLSMTVYDIAPGFDESQRAGVLQQIKETGSAIFERIHRRKNGTEFPVEVTVTQVYLDRAYGVAVARDISERKQAEARLREYQKALEGLEEMICVVDREYRYVIANRAFLDYRGMERERVVGHLATEMVEKEVFDSVVKKKLDECFAGKVVSYELKYAYPQRGERDLFISYFPIEGPNGVDRVVSVLQDITERKQAEEALQRSKAEAQSRAEELAVILDAVPGIALISRDPVGTSITGSRATYELLRLPYGTNLSMSGPEEHRPSNHRMLKDGREIPACEMPLQKAAATGREVRGSEVTVQFDDGTSCDVFGNAAPLRDRDGRVRGAVGVFVDVTERNRAEKSLRLFRMLVDETSDAIEVVDPDTLRFIDINGKSCLDLGYSREELLSMSVYDIDPNVDDALYAKLVHNMRSAGFMMLESLHRRKDGSTFPVEVSIKQVHLDRTYLVTVVRDITERKRAESALRRREESYRNFVAQSSEGIFRQDLDAPILVDLPEDELVHRILYDSYLAECNDAMAKMYGLNSPQEFVGRRLTETLDPKDPRNIELTRDYIRSGFRILERESREVDMLGNPKIFLNSMIGIVENGMLAQTWGIQRDITDRVRLEEAHRQAERALQESRNALARVARIATMGEFTASIAHEINQPLAALTTNTSASLRWLAAQPPKLAEAQQAMASAVEEANRASSVIERMRVLLMKSPPEQRPVDVNEVIREVLALTHSEMMTGDVGLHTALSTDVPAVFGDRIQLQQLMLNLIVNAIDAMIAVSDRPRKLLITSEKNPEGVLIQVQDSGKGLDPENVDRIFDAFFTTKAEGIGMGLSISRSIVEAHGGRLWATPGTPHGAVFQLVLPKAGSGE